MAYCLPPQLAEKFKQGIISGDIDPAKLSGMDSKARHAFFAEYLGDVNAESVNALFESKLLLKHQQLGMINWAKRVMGTNEVAKRDAISRIERMDKVLKPAEETAFLEDLAAHQLGTHVSYAEAQTIADLSAKVTEAKGAGGDRLDYGRAVVALKNYVGGLKANAEKFTVEDLKRNPVGSALKGVSELAGNAKAIRASMDNSAIFRQGWKTLWTHPQIWQANARKSFADIVKSFGKDKVMDELNADIVSRPNFDLMRRAGLDVGVAEEAYPTSLPEKIPVLGKFYKASENAFTAFVRKTRADVFDKYIGIAKETGVDLDDVQLQSIGKLVNSLTGRGHLGALEPAAKVVNNVFFSPRMLKSHVDTLLLHPTDEMSGFARKQAAINLLKIIGGTAAVLATARAVKKDSVELDPRSADFGKIRVGATRFDVSGGMASLVTLAAREATQSTKSSTTQRVTDLNSGKFGAQKGTDVVYNFFENKLSPAAAVVKDLMKGETFEGDKPTVGSEAKNLLVPLPVTTYLELKNNPQSANTLAAMIADALGIATNTYGQNPAADRRTAKAEIERMARAGMAYGEQARDYLKRGVVTAKDIGEAVREAKIPSQVRAFKDLPIDEALEAWGNATPVERRVLRPSLVKKAAAARELPAEQRAVLMPKIRAALAQ